MLTGFPLSVEVLYLAFLSFPYCSQNISIHSSLKSLFLFVPGSISKSLFEFSSLCSCTGQSFQIGRQPGSHWGTRKGWSQAWSRRPCRRSNRASWHSVQQLWTCPTQVVRWWLPACQVDLGGGVGYLGGQHRLLGAVPDNCGLLGGDPGKNFRSPSDGRLVIADRCLNCLPQTSKYCTLTLISSLERKRSNIQCEIWNCPLHPLFYSMVGRAGSGPLFKVHFLERMSMSILRELSHLICPLIQGRIYPQIWRNTKLFPNFRDKFVPKFGESPNLSSKLGTNSSPNLVNPQISPQISGQIRPQTWWNPKLVPKFRDKLVPKFGESPNLSPSFGTNSSRNLSPKS